MIEGSPRDRTPMKLTLPARPFLTLEAARLALAACEAEAVRNKWPVVIAIVDEGGHAIVLSRQDGTQWSSVNTAIEKARAAIAWKRPTRPLEEMVNNGRTAFLSIADGMGILQGGVPIEAGGAFVGAIGVSGVKASDDELVALAGVNALKAALG
jgi:glc operon protein GlcG